MATRRPFLLRVHPDLLEALQRWASEDLRSLNGHIEFLLRRDLQSVGRLPKPRAHEAPEASRIDLAIADDAPQADGWG